ncbi:MAG: hypothetical protein SF123_11835 [Chloroflexota bacterium]|nr:hypothetical protein [Chloroflexota bacterium]
MAKRKTSKRRYQMITFKVFEDTDSDILDWWEGIDEGERSDALRELIRGYLGKQPRRSKLLTIPELLEVRQDTLWIRDALNEMPGYLERLVQHVAVNGAAGIAMPPTARSPANGDVLPATEPALTDNDSDRRARRMKRSQW